jgi:hypothetical protein
VFGDIADTFAGLICNHIVEANLVATLWRGREKLHFLNPMPIHAISERWINKYEHGRLRLINPASST